ncbi:MAG: ABC transporter ATP-binding protein [Dehalococcoidia bacterium]
MTVAAPEVVTPPAASTAAITAKDLVHRYQPERGLRGLSLSVPRGTIYGLLGPNGSGKTTFLLLIAGLLEAKSGSLEVLGYAPGKAAAGRLGWVFQEQSLDPLLTVRETLALSAKLYRVSPHSVTAAADRARLDDRLDERVSTLSGGMRRRLELARALQHGPELLLLDEPTLGLDLESRRDFWALVDELRGDGLTVLLASNDVSEVEANCTRVAFLRDGRLVAEGSPAELRKGMQEQSIELHWPGLAEQDFDGLANLPGVSGAARSGDIVRLTTAEARRLLPRLLELKSGTIESIQVRESSLEDAYFRLTGHLIAGAVS